jgi:hypothetical protein
LASHGFAKEPIPSELAGQSWCGSTAALAAGLALASAAAASGAAAALALALAVGVGDGLSCFEQPKAAKAIANVKVGRMGRGYVLLLRYGQKTIA